MAPYLIPQSILLLFSDSRSPKCGIIHAFHYAAWTLKFWDLLKAGIRCTCLVLVTRCHQDVNAMLPFFNSLYLMSSKIAIKIWQYTHAVAGVTSKKSRWRTSCFVPTYSTLLFLLHLHTLQRPKPSEKQDDYLIGVAQQGIERTMLGEIRFTQVIKGLRNPELQRRDQRRCHRNQAVEN